MNKVFGGLLLLAAAAAAFFYFRKNGSRTEPNGIDQTLIIGKWVPGGGDSSGSFLRQYHYEFRKDGSLLLANDSAALDTTRYLWNKEGQLEVERLNGDSAHTVFRVLKLTRDSLQLQDKDSVDFLLLHSAEK